MITDICIKAVCDALDRGAAIVKFISANDAGVTRSHQAGFYLPKGIFPRFTTVQATKGENGEENVTIRWHDGTETDSTVKWYGKETRSEYRLTRFGKDFPWRSAERVGDLLVLVPAGVPSTFNAYVLSAEEDIEETLTSLGLSGTDSSLAEVFLADSVPTEAEDHDSCILRRFAEFVESLTGFPTTDVMADKTADVEELCRGKYLGKLPVDARLARLLEDEYNLFRMVERRFCLSEIAGPFTSVERFLSTAATLMNRRKSRSGKSLEKHTARLLREASIPFDLTPNVPGKPDFIIPGRSAYEDPAYPVDRLFMLAVKTTCKDRWRQVTREAPRVPVKHLLTTQKGISVPQLEEMRDAGVTLIVPMGIQKFYPDAGLRPAEILTFDGFIGSVRSRLAVG